MMFAVAVDINEGDGKVLSGSDESRSAAFSMIA
jgi:hypothetical protein